MKWNNLDEISPRENAIVHFRTQWRYPESEFISTAESLPEYGQRVEYKANPDSPVGVATFVKRQSESYTGPGFRFDVPYTYSGCGPFKEMGTVPGYWRPLAEEKLAGGHPDASLGHLVEQLRSQIRELQKRNDKQSETIASYQRENAELRRKKDESEHQMHLAIIELDDLRGGWAYPLVDHKLTSELPPPKGWNKVTETEPDPYSANTWEIHGRDGTFSVQRGRKWLKASPENLAEITYAKDIVEVKLQDGTIRKAYFNGVTTWHIFGNGCGIAGEFDVSGEPSGCANVPVKGTYFRKLAEV